MQIVDLVELEDGSAIVTIDMTAEEKHMLLESAVIIGLTHGIQLAKQERIDECLESAQSTSNT